jgi:hypothetical protein
VEAAEAAQRAAEHRYRALKAAKHRANTAAADQQQQQQGSTDQSGDLLTPPADNIAAACGSPKGYTGVHHKAYLLEQLQQLKGKADGKAAKKQPQKLTTGKDVLLMGCIAGKQASVLAVGSPAYAVVGDQVVDGHPGSAVHAWGNASMAGLAAITSLHQMTCPFPASHDKQRCVARLSLWAALHHTQCRPHSCVARAWHMS